MSLPALYTAPQSADDWDAWSFNHAAIHYDLVQAATMQKNVTGLQTFMLHPISDDDVGMWLYWHQTMHNQLNSVLKTSGYNLLQVDFEDPDSVSEWLYLNGDEHARFNAILGV